LVNFAHECGDAGREPPPPYQGIDVLAEVYLIFQECSIMFVNRKVTHMIAEK